MKELTQERYDRLVEMYNETVRSLNNATSIALRKIHESQREAYLKEIGWSTDRISAYLAKEEK